ncbi:MAG: glycosyltransferase family 39 protein [Chloroflexota bacterium]
MNITIEYRRKNPSSRTTNTQVAGAATRISTLLIVLGLFLLALGLRLLVWRWHEQYPLGGDEQEYLNAALTLLRERRYEELDFMRPPLYTFFLAASIYVFDSLVQQLRLVQAVISALTVIPMYALTYHLFRKRAIAVVAALLVAVNYTLAANATELLTETLFLFGLTIFFWLLLQMRDRRALIWPILAGLTLGALALLRSVALPLLPLAVLWLLVQPSVMVSTSYTTLGYRIRLFLQRHTTRSAFALVFTMALVIAPWTIRNYLTYDAMILIDTTGAENLWLDNDPAGREAVKQQLFPLGDDRAARQQLATERGVAVITADPGRFLNKAWGEAQHFFALQYFDDMSDRPEIWVPPLQIWLRLLLGDSLWLLILLGGAIGLWLAHPPPSTRPFLLHLNDMRWVFVPWAGYILLTGLVFHVELRYRLPLYPVLLPFAAWSLVWLVNRTPRSTTLRLFAATGTCVILLGLMLLHRPYVSETWRLGWKHTSLWQAQRAFAEDQHAMARTHARNALVHDEDSVLAYVALARADLYDGNTQSALDYLRTARDIMPDHPYAQLLYGAIQRERGQNEAAQTALAYERNSLQNLQSWSQQVFAPVQTWPESLDIGDGLDLGYINGFRLPEDGFRWTTDIAEIDLNAPSGTTTLNMELASGRPANAPAPTVVVLANGQVLGSIELTGAWETHSFPLDISGPVTVTIQSDTFRPRSYDPTSPDGRAIGVMVDAVALEGAEPS